jgi:hypothetical protein
MKITLWGLLLSTGSILTYLIQINGLTKEIWEKHEKLKELRDCPLCLGFWVFLVIGFFYKGKFISNKLNKNVDTLLFASTSTFLAHLIRNGWMSLYGYTVYKD